VALYDLYNWFKRISKLQALKYTIIAPLLIDGKTIVAGDAFMKVYASLVFFNVG